MQGDLFGAGFGLRLQPSITPKVDDGDALVAEDTAYQKASMTVDRVLFRAHDGDPMGSGALHQTFDAGAKEVLAGDFRIEDMPFRVVEVRSAGTPPELASHGDVLEPRSLCSELEVGFIELRGVSAVWAGSDVGENLDAGCEQ
jgi:hypothetical protein